MNTSPAASRRRLIIALSIVGVLLAGLIGYGIYGLIQGPPQTPTSAASAPTTTGNQHPDDAAVELLPALAVTDDPEEFARSVAGVLFEWDTMTNLTPALIVEHLLTVADPTGEETPGLYRDVTGYLPTASQWQQLRQYDTTQSLMITALGVPEVWASVVDDPANGLAEGTVAITIDGTRTRTGGWHGQETVKEYPVAFTLFLLCPPATEDCTLLRLSALDTPLR